MEVEAEFPKCAICLVDVEDPRALPCGHSFCGPSRGCLNSLDIREGLRCAVCRVVHPQVTIEALKPLYGIRDFLQVQALRTHKKVHLPCFMHTAEECTFWCTECNIMICEKCIDEDHDNHSMRKLRKHFVDKIESQFEMPLKDGLTKYKKILEKKIDCKMAELEKLQSDKKDADNYSKILRNEIPGKSVPEMPFLMHLSNVNLRKRNFLAISENTLVACGRESPASSTTSLCTELSEQSSVGSSSPAAVSSDQSCRSMCLISRKEYTRREQPHKQPFRLPFYRG